jgi:prepilin-type N-terminal cleavage/methylation domain-containing protein
MSRVRAGFTLFELLLVLLLIVIMYGLFVQNFSFGKKEEESVKLEKLNLYLSEHFIVEKEVVSLRCLDNCNVCKVLVDGNDTNVTLDVFEKDSGTINAYKYNGKRLEKVQFDDYHADEYKREKVCFRLDVYPNGSSDKIALEYKGKVYMFENYLEDGQVFASVLAAQDYLEKYQLEARGR